MSTHEWKYHFATLDEADRKDPFTIIDSFCGNATPFSTRKTFFELFSAAMCSHEGEMEDKSEWVWFFRIALQLIEAAYLINDLREMERLTYSIKPEG